MKTKLYTLIAFCILFASCKKTTSDAALNVDCQVDIDNSGNIFGPIGNCTIASDNAGFTSQETALFDRFDTANLTGTTKPTISNVINFPNPFSLSGGFNLYISSHDPDSVIIKLIITDARLNIVYSAVIPLNLNTTSIIHLTPNIPIGKYRLFYTVSAQSNDNYYKGWANIDISS